MKKKPDPPEGADGRLIQNVLYHWDQQGLGERERFKLADLKRPAPASTLAERSPGG